MLARSEPLQSVSSAPTTAVHTIPPTAAAPTSEHVGTIGARIAIGPCMVVHAVRATTIEDAVWRGVLYSYLLQDAEGRLLRWRTARALPCGSVIAGRARVFAHRTTRPVGSRVSRAVTIVTSLTQLQVLDCTQWSE